MEEALQIVRASAIIWSGFIAAGLLLLVNHWAVKADRDRIRKMKSQAIVYSMDLSASERKALELLRSNKSESLWNVAIQQVINDFSTTKFRRLISELKSQNQDEPEVMKQILGEAYETVVAL